MPLVQFLNKFSLMNAHNMSNNLRTSCMSSSTAIAAAAAAATAAAETATITMRHVDNGGMDRWTDGRRYKRTGRWMDRQTDKLTDRWMV